MGKPKQLLIYQGKTLIEHAVDEAIAASLSPVIVVTGSEADAVSALLGNKSVTIVRNEDWQEGMGTGIAEGIQTSLLKQDTLQTLIVAVCDQPFVSAMLFQDMIAKQKESKKGIVACAYANTLGTPVLFTAKYFEALQELDGADGAKRMVKEHADDVAAITFEKGMIDIDTEEDYRNLQQMQKQD